MGLSRLAIWLANGLLVLLACWIAAQTVDEAARAWLAPPPAPPPPQVAPPARSTPSWQDRQIILTRNLFDVSTLAPAPPPEEEEVLQATKLPLRLEGTVASEDPRRAWAAVENLKSHEHLVVRVDDRLLGRARVVRIERRRIVLDNGGRREELALEEAGGAPGGGARPAASRAGPRLPRPGELGRRVRQLTTNRFAVPRAEVESTRRDPASLFAQARILPKYEGGKIVGVQLSSIRPGSLFEKIGLEDGDTILELNGIQVGSPQDSAALLRELTEADHFEVVVRGSDGSQRTLTYDVGS